MRRLSLVLAGIAIAMGSQSADAHGTEGQDKKTAKPKAAAVEEKAFGRAGDPRKITRTIEISMTDQLRYDPAEVRVRAGDTVKFVVRNQGKTLHEIVLGTLPELKDHAELMRKFPNMEHDEAHMAHVKAGHKEDLIWQFTKPGEFYFGCLIPGHFEGGMVGKVIVAGK
jgi:uncharacterized cupredoxin-like copper-binding protein